MNNIANEHDNRRGRRGRRGCLTFVIVYGLSLSAMYLTSTRPETDDFTGRTARDFKIAGVATSESDDAVSFRQLNLDVVESGTLDAASLTFLLPEKRITIYSGDIHSAEILEDHGDWQLVAFYYSNTITSTSIYRAFRDRIEPVSYRLTSSVGHVFGAISLLIPAILLSWIASIVLNWRSNRLARSERS